MDVIAHKRSGVGFMYLVCTLLGLIFVGVGFYTSGEALLIAFMGLVVTGISAYIFISYLALPYAVITLDRENNLHLPKNKTVAINDVLDVSYRRASARGIQYKWGSVTLTTRLGSFKYGYIADCEEVAKRLTDLMYQAKYNKAADKDF